MTATMEPQVERIPPLRYVDAPLWRGVAEWATAELGMTPERLPAVEDPPDWVVTGEAPTVRAIASVRHAETIVVVDFGTVVEHRRHETWSDTPVCWGERADAPVLAGPSATPAIRCADARCFGTTDSEDFPWWGTR